MSGNFLEVGVKSEKFCPAPTTLSVDLVGCLKLLGVYKRARSNFVFIFNYVPKVADEI